MLDSICHMTFKILKNRIFRVKTSIFPPQAFTQRNNGRHECFLKICKPLVVYRFYCMALYYSQTRRRDKLKYFRLYICKTLRYCINPADKC